MSAYGSPLPNATVSIFTGNTWQVIGRSSRTGQFIIPPNTNITLPTLLKSTLSPEGQIELLQIQNISNQNELIQALDTITYFGVVDNNEQTHANVTPWTTAAISIAIGQHVGMANLEELQSITPTEYENISETSEKMKAMFQNYFSGLSITETSNPLNIPFLANGTGFDLILDMFAFNIDTQSGESMLTNRVTQESFNISSETTEVIPYDSTLFSNNPVFGIQKVTAWMGKVNQFFNRNSDINSSDIIDQNYLHNTHTYNDISNEFELIKRNEGDITLYLPRINACSKEEKTCQLSILAKLSQQDNDYVLVKEVQLKFSEDGQARLYGNQNNKVTLHQLENKISFQQNIQKNTDTLSELPENYSGFAINIPRSNTWSTPFIQNTIPTLPSNSNSNLTNAILYLVNSQDISNAETSVKIGEAACTENYRSCSPNTMHFIHTRSNFITFNTQQIEVLTKLIELGNAYLAIDLSNNSGSVKDFYIPVETPPITYSQFKTMQWPSIDNKDLKALKEWRGTESINLNYDMGSVQISNVVVDIFQADNTVNSTTINLTSPQGRINIPPQTHLSPKGHVFDIRLIGRINSMQHGESQFEWIISNCIDAEGINCPY